MIKSFRNVRIIDKMGQGLSTLISGHVINLLIKHLLISPTLFMSCKVVPRMEKGA